MKIIFDARGLTLYPVGGPGFTGGTELMLRELARGLAKRGHTVHVVTPDLNEDEQRGPTEFWWGPVAHPTRADAVVICPDLTRTNAAEYSGDALILATNGIDPNFGPDGKLADVVSAFPVFSQCHGRMLCAANPTVDPAKCVVTGLGVDLSEYGDSTSDPLQRLGVSDAKKRRTMVPGRIWVGNDPARGLWSVLDVFDIVLQKMPEASLHVSYDFDSRFSRTKWQHSALAEMLWECARRLKTIPNVVNRGSLTREEVVREQLEAQVHLWPADPPNRGSQIHGISQMEAAAAGCALVLSDIEAFPEVFGDAARILPVPGYFEPSAERRCDAQDYADVVLELMRDPEKWSEASRKARALAEQHTWAAVVDRWDQMLSLVLAGEEKAA